MRNIDSYIDVPISPGKCLLFANDMEFFIPYFTRACSMRIIKNKYSPIFAKIARMILLFISTGMFGTHAAEYLFAICSNDTLHFDRFRFAIAWLDTPFKDKYMTAFVRQTFAEVEHLIANNRH
ncbi:MAG: hypothetical protein M0R33_13835 [Methylomonas sp.]|uniref:hypothetical protein n=1 Tax=Methylomonas sp. TaxID=418 RepID=UPI0026006476|nr:hypothetical protein [Methylomonas sp.]MCK9607516.1 hypothetical protein [Methylomonas sp.]